MSNLTSLDRAIRVDLLGGYSETPIFFGNVPEKNKGRELVKVFIVRGPGEKESVAGANQLYPSGAIMIQIFSEINKGENRVNEIADIIIGMMSGKQLDEGHLDITDITPIPGEDPTQRYHQLNLEARFIFSYQL